MEQNSSIPPAPDYKGEKSTPNRIENNSPDLIKFANPPPGLISSLNLEREGPAEPRPEVYVTQVNILYKPKRQTIYPIPETDWERLKRTIRQILPYGSLLQVFGAVFYGVVASGIFSIMAFHLLSGIPPWLKPAAYAITISSFIIGTVFFILDRSQKRGVTGTVNNVLEEMELIEEQIDKTLDE